MRTVRFLVTQISWATVEMEVEDVEMEVEDGRSPWWESLGDDVLARAEFPGGWDSQADHEVWDVEVMG